LPTARNERLQQAPSLTVANEVILVKELDQHGGFRRQCRRQSRP